MNTYALDLSALTIIRTDAHGESHDLNADGDPCETAAELADLARELEAQGYYGPEVTAELLASIPADPYHLVNYLTNEVIREATEAEAEASKEAALLDGGAGVILVDGVSCYVV